MHSTPFKRHNRPSCSSSRQSLKSCRYRNSPTSCQCRRNPVSQRRNSATKLVVFRPERLDSGWLAESGQNIQAGFRSADWTDLARTAKVQWFCAGFRQFWPDFDHFCLNPATFAGIRQTQIPMKLFGFQLYLGFWL